MARESADYRNLLLSLLPRGKAWSKAVGSRLYEYFDGQSLELARVDDRIQDLHTERDTLTTVELIEEHEEDLGLPEGCLVGGVPFFPNLTLTERQLRANSKLLAVGQQDKGYFIEIAERLGFTATITEFEPFWCGLMGAGDPCGDQINLFYWSFNIVYSGDVIYFLSGEGSSGDPLAKITDLLEAVFCYAELYKPAHTIVIHSIVGPEFGYGFDSSFNSYQSDTPEHLEGDYGWDDWSEAFNKARNVAYTKAFEETDFGVYPLT
jgi:uncharacterized protein YmfQ (DUF2313 family)